MATAMEIVASRKRSRTDVATTNDSEDGPLALMQKSLQQLNECCNVLLPDHDAKIKRLEQKTKAQENYSRSYNVYIDGLPEELSVERLKLSNHVCDLLNSNLIHNAEDKLVIKDIDDAHRVSSLNGGSEEYPTVLIRFVSKKYPAIIMRNRSQMKQYNEDLMKNEKPPISFSLDYDAECQAEKRFLLVVRRRLMDRYMLKPECIKVFITNGEAHVQYVKDSSMHVYTAYNIPNGVMDDLKLTRFVPFVERKRGGNFRGRGGGRRGGRGSSTNGGSPNAGQSGYRGGRGGRGGRGNGGRPRGGRFNHRYRGGGAINNSVPENPINNPEGNANGSTAAITNGTVAGDREAHVIPSSDSSYDSQK